MASKIGFAKKTNRKTNVISSSYLGCMLTCDKDYCNGSSPLSTESGLDALLLTICLCMAATQIVLTLMYGYEPFALF